MNKTTLNGWNEWSKYVLKELERLNATYISLEDKTGDNYDKLHARINSTHKIVLEKIGKINIDVATLKVKAGVWGAIAGMIPVVVFMIFTIFN